MPATPVTFKDYVAWTIQDLSALTKIQNTPDDELMNLPLIDADQQDKPEEAQFFQLEKDLTPEVKRERNREAVLPRLREVYGNNLNIMANAAGGMTPILENFFKGLDDVFKADTKKPKEDNLTSYLERNILKPVRDLVDNGLQSEPVLNRVQYVFNLVKEKI